jgi:hypothetical protein
MTTTASEQASPTVRPMAGGARADELTLTLRQTQPARVADAAPPPTRRRSATIPAQAPAGTSYRSRTGNPCSRAAVRPNVKRATWPRRSSRTRYAAGGPFTLSTRSSRCDRSRNSHDASRSTRHWQTFVCRLLPSPVCVRAPILGSHSLGRLDPTRGEKTCDGTSLPAF